MLRFSLIISLVACTHPQAPVAPQQPAPLAKLPAPTVAPDTGNTLCLGGHCERNFVCERLAEEGNTKARCVPEQSDVGEHHAHSARITIDGQTIICAVNDTALSVVCAPMFYQPQQATEDAAAKAEFAGPVKGKAKAPAKAPKK